LTAGNPAPKNGVDSRQEAPALQDRSDGAGAGRQRFAGLARGPHPPGSPDGGPPRGDRFGNRHPAATLRGREVAGTRVLRRRVVARARGRRYFPEDEHIP
jgi:hypothetical protein